MHIKRIELHKFKRFDNHTIDLQPLMSLVVGGNNSGKSSLLHALATWEFCKQVLYYEKSHEALYTGFRGAGIGISIDDFTPLNIPNFKYLWTNLHVDSSYSLSITCYWDDATGVEKHLQISLALAQERLFIKNTSSDVAIGQPIPKVAYLPTFAGIDSKEQWYPTAMRNKLTGQGLAGAVLRNQIVQFYMNNLKLREEKKAGRSKLLDADLKWIRANDPYELLQQVVGNVFKGQLYPKNFDPNFHTHVTVNFRKGEWINKRFKAFSTYNERDIMVEGSGFLQWLSVYTFALAEDIDVLLLDEPDAHLHCSLQNTLLSLLEDIAKKKNKQVLVATHSSEVIKTFDFKKILFIDGQSIHYLSDDNIKIRLLSGLGSDYHPLMESIQRYKRILFVENQTDADYLKIFCEKYSHWPSNLVVWPRADHHKERKVLYEYLAAQIHDLKCISLSDRDNESYASINANMSLRGMPDRHDSNGCELRYRTWRRWEMESYLFCKPAITRMIQVKSPGKTLEQAEADFDTYMAGIGLVYPADYKESNKTTSNGRLFDADAKEVFLPLCNHFGIDKKKIAKEMTDAEIFDDVRNLINEIITMCS